MDNPAYNKEKSSFKNFQLSNSLEDSKMRVMQPQLIKENDKEHVWDGIIGDEIAWDDMSTCEKVKRILINVIKVSFVFIFLYFFICSLDMLSSSFRLISGKSTGSVMGNKYIGNPVVGLMIGILVTVLVQSSSTSTSIIVSMVASQILHVHEAIPMIMGANIGTSVTNTIVSLTQVGDREQFQRAFSGATVHDMFNWLCVAVLLPVEIFTGLFEKLTGSIVHSFSNGNGAKIKLLDVLTEPFTDLIVELDSKVLKCWGMGAMMDEDSMIKKYCKHMPANTTYIATTEASLLNQTEMFVAGCGQRQGSIGVPNSCHFIFHETGMSDSTIGIILLIVSLSVLTTSLICIVKLLNSMLMGSIAKVIKTVINSDIPYVPWLTGYIAIFIGAILTFIVQSSSVFTSTLTPLIGIGMIDVERAYPLTLGSNIGTTTTALLAAMAADGDKSDSIQIALVHLFFNIFGIMIFYPIPFMRFPITLCKALGNITAKYRWFAILYLFSMFFILPGAIFALSLGGPLVMWCVLIPILILVMIIVAINLVQEKFPSCLPSFLKSWSFLPLCLRSLEPYDKVLTALPCCSKCRSSPEEEECKEVVAAAPRKTSLPPIGIDNPVPIYDDSKHR